MIDAVIFDLDGVIIESEAIWEDVRRQLIMERGGHYPAEAQHAIMGMSSPEWSRYLHESLGVAGPPAEISAEVVRRMIARYRQQLPLIPGATDAIRRLAAHRPDGLGLASSSNRELIDAVLETAGVSSLFRTTVSSEEVARGKPSPDVYLEAARRLGVAPERCAAVEDSHNGLRAAKAAGMRVIAIPSPTYPPEAAAVALADVVLRSIAELTVAVVDPEAVQGR
jgi:HAD superfamily hydrolase (TIGR01509 family)